MTITQRQERLGRALQAWVDGGVVEASKSDDGTAKVVMHIPYGTQLVVTNVSEEAAIEEAEQSLLSYMRGSIKNHDEMHAMKLAVQAAAEKILGEEVPQ